MPADQIGGWGWWAARPWKDRILGFWMTPSRISMARRIVTSSSQPAGPRRTLRRWGRRASLMSQVAEFHDFLDSVEPDDFRG